MWVYNHMNYLELLITTKQTKNKVADIFYGTYPFMMTSSNGNIFRVTVHLYGEFTGPGEFLAQRPVTPSFDVAFDLRMNKRLSKQSWGWWFETQSSPLWCQCNVQWHHNEPNSVLNHQRLDCLLNRLFRRSSKENSKAPCHWPLWGECSDEWWIPRPKGQ